MNTDNVIENIDQDVQEIGELVGIEPSGVTVEPANTDFFVENINANVKAIAETLDVTPYEVEAEPANTDLFVENIAKNVVLIKDNFSGGGDVTVEALTVTENGTYQEEGKAYSPVNVNVQSVGLPREVTANGVYGFPTQQFTLSLPSTVTDLAPRILNYAFQYCASLTSVNFSSLTTVSGLESVSSAFRSCTSLTSVNLSSLTTVSGEYSFSSAFHSCTSLTSVDLSSLTTVSAQSALNNAFRSCTSLASVNLSSLTTVSGSSAFSNAFNGCTSLLSLSFPSLTASSFGTAKDQFYNMLAGVTGCTVHFPAAIQSTIGSWPSVTGGFGGKNTTVLFDL